MQQNQIQLGPSAMRLKLELACCPLSGQGVSLRASDSETTGGKTPGQPPPLCKGTSRGQNPQCCSAHMLQPPRLPLRPPEEAPRVAQAPKAAARLMQITQGPAGDKL